MHPSALIILAYLRTLTFALLIIQSKRNTPMLHKKRLKKQKARPQVCLVFGFCKVRVGWRGGGVLEYTGRGALPVAVVRGSICRGRPVVHVGGQHLMIDTSAAPG
jgi:hypothetical protein